MAQKGEDILEKLERLRKGLKDRKKPNVAKIELRGFFGRETAESVERQLRNAEQDDNIQAVLLYINSPGGDIYYSSRLMNRVKKSKKPVYALIESLGTSAAYWVASGTKKIVAGDTSDVGAIGNVGLSLLNFHKLLEKLGIEYILVDAGKHWSLNQYGPIDQEAVKQRQEVVNKCYQKFVTDVAENRRLSKEVVEGYNYPSDAPSVLGSLVDAIGYEEDALRLIKEDLKLDEARVGRPGRLTLFGLQLGYARMRDSLSSYFSQGVQAVYRAR